MSVYLIDGGVVLNGGSVATSSDCCCITGACCVGTDCTIETEDDCTGMGGTYQGDDTTCDPNPCEEPPPATGACCVGESCTIETEEDCTGMGGTYRGDDTTCDPNPCGLPPNCNCLGWDGFMGSGLMYLTRDTVKTVTTQCFCCRIDVCNFPECVGVWTVHEEYDPVTCEYTTSETGRTGHCKGCKFDDICCNPFTPGCTEGAGCSDSGDCGNPSFDFDMDAVSTLCFGAGGYCSPSPDSDSHESCTAGSAFCYHCGPPPGGDCDCTCGDGSDIVFTVDVTLSNPCTPI